MSRLKFDIWNIYILIWNYNLKMKCDCLQLPRLLTNCSTFKCQIFFNLLLNSFPVSRGHFHLLVRCTQRVDHYEINIMCSFGFHCSSEEVKILHVKPCQSARSTMFLLFIHVGFWIFLCPHVSMSMHLLNGVTYWTGAEVEGDQCF